MNRKLITNGKHLINSIKCTNMATSRAGLQLKDVINKLEDFAPTRLSEKWDNTGVLIEPFTPKIVSKILLTNDLTEAVMEEALEIDTDLIISYHPPIFSGMKRITNSTWKERLASRCLENRIAVYSPHTSWDAVMGGVNDWLSKCLPDHMRKFLNEIDTQQQSGAGRLCELKTPTPLSEIIESVKIHTEVSHVQLAIARGCSVDSKISTVGICAGSGSSVLNPVKADLYLTGEMSHHDVLDAVHRGTSVILTNHSNSERGFLKEFQGRLIEMLDNKVDVMVSVEDKDPLTTV